MRKNTYNKVMMSLTQILQTTPYEDLTVVNLCQHAQITRRTFYNNYKSIDELIRKIFLEMFFDKCYSQMKDESYFESENFINSMIDTWDRYGNLFLALEKWNVLEYLTKDNINIIMTLIKEKFSDPFITKYSEYFITSTYASIGNLCMIWLKRGRIETKDELKILIKKFVYHQQL